MTQSLGNAGGGPGESKRFPLDCFSNCLIAVSSDLLILNLTGGFPINF